MIASGDINSIRDWVGFLKNMKAPDGYYNRGELLEKYGWGFIVGPRTFEGPRGRQHACFENSAKMVFDDPKLVYVEGYATVMGVPIEHAWVIKKSDATRVIDPTMKQPDFKITVEKITNEPNFILTPVDK